MVYKSFVFNFALASLAVSPCYAQKMKAPEVYAAVVSDESTLPTKVKKLTPKFDPVAPDQKESIIQRLKLIETLIRNHGQAYDYRVLTNAQLQKILDELKPVLAPKVEEEKTIPERESTQIEEAPLPQPLGQE